MFNLDEYTTVKERIRLFWEKYPDGAIFTEILDWSDTRFITKTSLYRLWTDERPFSTGHAKEEVSERGVNRDFALENCETSSVGVAMKNANIGTDKHGPSREEMMKVVKTQMKDKKEYVPVPKEDDPWTIKTVAMPITSEQAVETVKDIIGGTTDKDIPTCACGKQRILRTGTGKNGKQWAAWDCCYKASNYQVGQQKPCDPERIWLELNSLGQWQAQKVRG